MSQVSIVAEFGTEFKGKIVSERSEILIGRDKEESSPYHMLLGALAGCMHATFLEIIKKKRIEIKHANIEVLGTKREEIPTWLEHVEMNYKISIEDESKHKAVESSMELAKKYCSVYNTIEKVAKIDLNIIFE